MFIMLCLSVFALMMAAAPDLHEMADTITLAGEPAVTDTDDQDLEAAQSEPETDEAAEVTEEPGDEAPDDQDPDADPDEGAEAAQSDEEPDLSFLDEEEVADPTREENIPAALRPMWRSAQAQITREQQRVAEQRKELEQMAPLDRALRDAGFTPEQYAEVAQALQAAQSAPQGYLPQAEPEPTDTADPYASDPEILHLQAQLEEATTGPEEAALQQSIRMRAREIQRDLAAQQQNAQQQAYAREQAIQNDLSRLEADARFKTLLSDPANRTRITQTVKTANVPVEVVAKALDYDRLHLDSEKRTRLAYKKGLELGRTEGRNGRAVIREASLPVGPSAKTAQDSKELVYQKGASLADMANQAEEKGLKWFKRR
jgi:hypothetical protein